MSLTPAQLRDIQMMVLEALHDAIDNRWGLFSCIETRLELDYR